MNLVPMVSIVPIFEMSIEQTREKLKIIWLHVNEEHSYVTPQSIVYFQLNKLHQFNGFKEKLDY